MRILLASVVLACTIACSTTSSSPSADASVADGGVDATVDAMAQDDVISSTDVLLDPLDDATSFNDCTPFDFASNDHTAAADPRTITFPFDVSPAQYQPRCMKIRAGQTVTWRGDFRFHPLSPAGGDVPSPITIDPMPSGTERKVAFPNTGFYGFECATHEAPAMYGAILVVP